MLKQNIHRDGKIKRKGQSTVEFIVLVAAVIGVMIVFLGPGGPFQIAYNSTLATGTNGMTNMASRLSGSRVSAP